ncbi:Arm DNA-binding domain-containing protein [Paraburkholderia sp. MMS20-SJTN17]|uniref:Arm DNA-binding domain-containing protein n=1 Tax=Paraburkholderia translucens TaxID=2886945 RepID=A0ABS8KHE8_9BURK|nr:Arm DNA-binding domain-containing protein [Paraburkholderia sp. MMS20-SJTN17]MCC8403868.1 Arm DNA-binding domain-containing protein [Paraburkholderia sp. MMS20-SJTN17]
MGVCGHGPASVNRLTPLATQRAAKSGYYPDGNGLFLVVGKGAGAEVGGKSWLFGYEVYGKATETGLGSADIVTLAGALSVSIWQPEQGEPRPQVRLNASAVLSACDVTKRRAAASRSIR